MSRVVITGMGVISPLGLTLSSIWESLSERKSGVRACLPKECLPVPYAAFADAFTGNIDDFGNLEPQLKKSIRKGLKLMSREIQMCIAATQRAIADAGIFYGQLDPERVGTSIGCDYILTTADELIEAFKACFDDNRQWDFCVWGEKGLAKMTPLWQLKYLSNMPSCHIAIYNDFRGICSSVTLREASIGATVGEAVYHIKSGKADVMVVGATGSRLHPVKMMQTMLAEQVMINDMPPETVSRPFDCERYGMVLGEGAGSLILESEEHAKKRGAKIYGEVVCGTYLAHVERIGHNPAFMRRKALTRAMTLLLERTGISPDSIGHINAHGLSESLCDAEEAHSIRYLFRERRIPVTAAKSYFGNLGAGSGAVEMIAGVLALQKNKLFPILNNVSCDGECPITPVREFGVAAGDSFIKLCVSPQAQASAILIRKAS